MYAYRVAYDGTPYHGFQRQPDLPTVEDALLGALDRLDVLESKAETPPGYAAAGRTDAGVSARCQTVAFEAPDWLSPVAFNSELPESIRVWAHTPVEESFHATHHATAREYTYLLYAPSGADSLAHRGLDRLAGTHDFHNLTPDETGTERTLQTGMSRDGPFLVLQFSADGFPRQFVRRAVTLIEELLTGEAQLDRIDRVLDSRPVSGPAGIEPAAPTPLVLTAVSYPGIEFRPDEDAVADARRLFEQLRASRGAGMRVASLLSQVGTQEPSDPVD